MTASSSTELLSICFGCLANENLVSVRSSDDNYFNMFDECMALQLSDSVLSNFLCCQCIDNLKRAFDFKKRVICSQQYLKKLLIDDELVADIKSEPLFKYEDSRAEVKSEANESDGDIWSEWDEKVPLNILKSENQTVNAVKPVKRKKRQKKSLDSKAKKRKTRVKLESLPLQAETEVIDILDCKECLTNNFKPYERAVHMYNVHKITLPAPEHAFILKCDTCNVAFATKRLFNVHMALVHRMVAEKNVGIPKRTTRCKECYFFFSTSNRKEWHMYYTHNGKKPKSRPAALLRCRVCRRQFKLKSERKKHMLEEHGILRLFPCEYCGQQLNSNTSLRTHINRLHLKVIEAICAYCNKEFYSKFDLIDHFICHGLNVKYCSCDVCGKHFPRSSNLRQHMKVHMEKMEVCSLCGMRFTFKSTLKAHLKGKHGQYLNDNSITNGAEEIFA